MTSRTPRRTFLQTMAVASAGLPLGLKPAGNAAPTPAAAQLRGRFFDTHFDPSTGRLHAWRKGGTAFLVNVLARAVLAAGT